MTELNPLYSLSVKSVCDEDHTPYVFITYTKTNYSFAVSPEGARDLGVLLIKACAIAENESKILLTITQKLEKSFDKNLEKQRKEALKLVGLIRSSRCDLPSEIYPFFGEKTKQPLIRYRLPNEEELCLEIKEVLDHAKKLIASAEAAESDAFIYQFYDANNLSKEEAISFLTAFSKFRQVNELENLLDK